MPKIDDRDACAEWAAKALLKHIAKTGAGPRRDSGQMLDAAPGSANPGAEADRRELLYLRSQVSGLRMFHKWATAEIASQAETILRLSEPDSPNVGDMARLPAQ